MKPIVNVFWFRRDLRLDDNAGLCHALESGLPVIPVFIFDTNILNDLEDRRDRRVYFIFDSLRHIQEQLLQFRSSLEVYHGKPEMIFGELIKKYSIEKVFTNHDYDPYAQKRDTAIEQLLKNSGVQWHTYKDQVIFEKDEILKENGKPYTVFTPYSKKWKSALTEFCLKSFPAKKYFNNFYPQEAFTFPSLESMGFEKTFDHFPPQDVSNDVLIKYREQRDFPGTSGTSRLSVHLRFGTISIRRLAQKALYLNETFLNELVWRDFYHAILWHFPHVGQGKSFRPEYDLIRWRNDESEFEKWCGGQTGYPIVDAGMRELNATGFMHNRVRMIVASFLTKHLLIDWRWGEAYFAKKLLDYDLAANNGGWQWAAGSGCDAAPYFRIFNPYSQTQKFDPELKYVCKWVPEHEQLSYPVPIVDHEFARKRVMAVYAAALKK
jgi:deoxyribodipyrimidine photo-lyase